MVTYGEWKKEKEDWERLRARVDGICRDITEGRIRSHDQMMVRGELARELCAEMFPDRLELFDTIYLSRFERLWAQFGKNEDPVRDQPLPVS